MFAHLPPASSSSLYGRVTPLWRGVGAAPLMSVHFIYCTRMALTCAKRSQLLLAYCCCSYKPCHVQCASSVIAFATEDFASLGPHTASFSPVACESNKPMRLTVLRTPCAGATLARDVPFSALYWSGLEPIRRAMLPVNSRPSQAQIMTANFVAGTVGGGLAAAVTTPLDVVKTRLQVHPALQGCKEVLKLPATSSVACKETGTPGVAGYSKPCL